MTVALPQDWGGLPPQSCDLCRRRIGDVFFDGRTKMGSWATMCPACHRNHGIGLGIGYGQEYRLQASGQFLAVAGYLPTED